MSLRISVLSSINELIFVMEKQIVFWKEEIEFVNTIQMNFIFQRGETLCVAL
jgi:hypothetical protein